MTEIQSLISEGDHDQGPRENHDHGHEHAVRAAVLPEDLKHRIVKQVTLPPLPIPSSNWTLNASLGFAWYAIFVFSMH